MKFNKIEEKLMLGGCGLPWYYVLANKLDEKLANLWEMLSGKESEISYHLDISRLNDPSLETTITGRTVGATIPNSSLDEVLKKKRKIEKIKIGGGEAVIYSTLLLQEIFHIGVRKEVNINTGEEEDVQYEVWSPFTSINFEKLLRKHYRMQDLSKLLLKIKPEDIYWPYKAGKVGTKSYQVDYKIRQKDGGVGNVCFKAHVEEEILEYRFQIINKKDISPTQLSRCLSKQNHAI